LGHGNILSNGIGSGGGHGDDGGDAWYNDDHVEGGQFIMGCKPAL